MFICRCKNISLPYYELFCIWLQCKYQVWINLHMFHKFKVHFFYRNLISGIYRHFSRKLNIPHANNWMNRHNLGLEKCLIWYLLPRFMLTCSFFYRPCIFCFDHSSIPRLDEKSLQTFVPKQNVRKRKWISGLRLYVQIKKNICKRSRD